MVNLADIFSLWEGYFTEGGAEAALSVACNPVLSFHALLLLRLRFHF